MEKYKDIIDLPYPKSNARPHMSMMDRAAQFSPFAALTGYEEAIEEEARLTDAKILLGEDEKKEIGEKLRVLSENISKTPEIRISYFVTDERKSGGRYLTMEGRVKKVRDFEQEILMETGEIIPFQDILWITGGLFD